MKFRFRLEAVLRQRKMERDAAQREHALAAAAVREQLARIQRMYGEIDAARERTERLQSAGGNCVAEILSIDGFVEGQKIRILKERNRARELMAIEEEKLEVLTGKAQTFKVLEKLREKKLEEFKEARDKKEMKQVEDMVTMRFEAEEEA